MTAAGSSLACGTRATPLPRRDESPGRRATREACRLPFGPSRGDVDILKRDYPSRPLVGVGVVVLRGDSVLLVKRGGPPDEGRWSIPGGAQELGETVEATARRELEEETGVAASRLHLLTHIDSIHRDSAGRVQYHYTILDFAAAWLSGEPRAGGDVSEAGFFAPEALERLELRREAHRVIALARDRLAD